MLDYIRKFYNRTKLTKKDVPRIAEGETDIVDLHVFYKEYPRLPSVPLPEVTHDGELFELLNKRESERTFSQDPISLEELAYILSYHRIVDGNRKPERRTYPSAGARFPIELYIIVFNVEGLDPGAYHYNIKRHSLETLLTKDLREEELMIVSPYLKNTSAAIVLTSVIARSEVKYGIRAYPFSLLEAGHITQNILLACAKYGVATCPVAGFANDRVSKILDLTSSEIPIYVIGMGKL